VTPRVPASILQVVNSVLTVSGSVAEDYSTDIGERRTAIPSVRWGGELP
jgi:hypothetical protein